MDNCCMPYGMILKTIAQRYRNFQLYIVNYF